MGERLGIIVSNDGTMAAGHTEAKQMILSVFKLKNYINGFYLLRNDTMLFCVPDVTSTFSVPCLTLQELYHLLIFKNVE